MGEFKEPRPGGVSPDPDEEPTEDLVITEEDLGATEEDIGELDLESMDDTEFEEQEITRGMVEFFTEKDDTGLIKIFNEGSKETLEFLVRDNKFIEEAARAVNAKWKEQMVSYRGKIKTANERLRQIEDQNVATLIATGEVKSKERYKLLISAARETVHAIVKVAKPTLDKSADPEDEFFT